MGAEVASACTGLEHGDFTRCLLCEILYPSFSLRRWQMSCRVITHILVMDARTVFDALQSDSTATDKRIALDVAAIKESIGDDLNTLIRWLPGPQQPGDELTKHASNGTMSEICDQGLWCLVETNEVRELREAQQANRRALRHKAKLKRDTVESPFGVLPMSGPAEASVAKL